MRKVKIGTQEIYRGWREVEGLQATFLNACELCVEKESGIRLKVIKGKGIQENRMSRESSLSLFSPVK